MLVTHEIYLKLSNENLEMYKVIYQCIRDMFFVKVN